MVANDYSKFYTRKGHTECNTATFTKNLSCLVNLYRREKAGKLPKPLISAYLKLFEDVEQSFGDFRLSHLSELAGRINDCHAALDLTAE